MSRRWRVLWGLLLLAALAGCDLMAVTPPTAKPKSTATAKTTATATLPPATETPPPWPAERLTFSHLDKIWFSDGDGPRALTLGDSPVLSPDGNHIAYLLPAGETPGHTQVYVLDLRTNAIALISGPPAFFGTPVWSPNSRSVAYLSEALLVVADISGDPIRAVASDVGFIGEGELLPAWTSDAQTIVCPLTRVGPPELFAVSLEGGQAVQLTHTGGYETSAPYVVLTEETMVGPADTVLFTNLSDGGTLWAVNLEGEERRRVLPQVDHVVDRLFFSPKGLLLAGLRRTDDEQGGVLWSFDLIGKSLELGQETAAVPVSVRWGQDGSTFYWVAEGALFAFPPDSGGQTVAALPPPSPTPTVTPLRVAQHLLYYLEDEDEAAFYEAEPYAEAQFLRYLPASQAVSGGYVLHGGGEAFPSGAVVFPKAPELYLLEPLEGGFPRWLYAFQEVGLESLDVIWSLQGDALLCVATYEQEEDTVSGRRVDLGVIGIQGKGHQARAAALNRFAFLTDAIGATPLLYDEESGEAVVVPRGQDGAFSRLEVYDVASGELKRVYPVEGQGTAAVSPDLHWAVSTGYDEQAGRGLLRLYDLTAAQIVALTASLPEGTFASVPLRWSPDGQYAAFVLIEGSPFDPAEDQSAQEIWVLQPEPFAARSVVALDVSPVYLMGWR